MSLHWSWLIIVKCWKEQEYNPYTSLREAGEVKGETVVCGPLLLAFSKLLNKS